MTFQYVLWLGLCMDYGSINTMSSYTSSLMLDLRYKRSNLVSSCWNSFVLLFTYKSKDLHLSLFAIRVVLVSSFLHRGLIVDDYLCDCLLLGRMLVSM